MVNPSVSLLRTMLSWTLTTLMLGTLCGVATSTYVSRAKYDTPRKSSKVTEAPSSSGRRYGSLFKHDKDVRKYLSMFGTDAMIWRCKNALQEQWNWKPLPVVELYCEAIGTMRDARWFHNGKVLNTAKGNHHSLSIYPHHHRGHYFYSWIDFRLKIFNATRKDSGIYTFEIIGKHGSIQTQNVYVDISSRHLYKRKWRKHNKHHQKSTSKYNE